jgi:S1-C subfamily serine protease
MLFVAQLEVKVCDQPVTRTHIVPACHYQGDTVGLEYHNAVITNVAPDSAAEASGIKMGESIFEVCNGIPQ